MPPSSRLSTLRSIKQSVTAVNRQALHTTCRLSAESDAQNGTTEPSQRPGQPRGSRSELAARQVSRLGRRRVQGIVGMTRKDSFTPVPSSSVDPLITRTPTTDHHASPRPVFRNRDSAARSRPAPRPQLTDGKSSPLARSRALSKPISAKEFRQQRDPSRRNNSRRDQSRQSNLKADDGAMQDVTPEEDKAAEELFWIKRAQIEETDSQPYNPGSLEHSDSLAISNGALITNRTASLAGTSGPATEIKAMMGRLAHRPDDTWANDEDLTRRLLGGNIVQFKDAEERQRVLKLANEKAVAIANRIAIRKSQPFAKREVGWAPITGSQRETLVGRVLKGQYQLHDKTKDKGAAAQAMGHAQAMLELKETTTSDARKMFLDTFKSLWPAQAAAVATSAAKSGKSTKKGAA